MQEQPTSELEQTPVEPKQLKETGEPEQPTSSTNDDNKGEEMAKNQPNLDNTGSLDETKPTEENKSSFGETAKKVLAWTKDAGVKVIEYISEGAVYVAKATFMLVTGYAALYIAIVIFGLTFSGAMIAVGAIGAAAYLVANHIKHGPNSIFSVAKNSAVISARSVSESFQNAIQPTAA
jgi:hypothetical protein